MAVEREPNQRKSVLVVDAVDRANLCPTQLNPSTWVELSIGACLQAQMHRVTPWQRQRNEDQDGEGDRRHRREQTDQPGAFEACSHCPPPDSSRRKDSRLIGLLATDRKSTRLNSSHVSIS